MIRDSRAGSILIAKLIAVVLGGIIEVLTRPAERVFAVAVNFVVLHGFRDEVPPLGEFASWSYTTLGLFLLFSMFWLGMAYLFAAWVYKPSPRRG
jgi:hypothetical protein